MRTFSIAVGCVVVLGVLACSDSTGRKGASGARAGDPGARAESVRSADRGGVEAEDEPVSGPRFRVPDAVARQQAIGLGGTMSPVLDRVLYEHSGFAPKRAPDPGDWLDQHDEPGQTYSDYLAMRPNRPGASRSTIYILPIADGASSGRTGYTPPMEHLAEYARIFFATPVTVLPSVSVAEVGATERKNPWSGDRQLLTTDILAYLRTHLPEDAYALIALTGIDLYPEDSWNFVFGQASLRERVGVYSLARYQPGFDGDDDPDSDGTPGVAPVYTRQVVLRRALKVMSHELGHMFGIEHCVYFECVMNGSNSLPETDDQPMHLCPVDLRKVLHATRATPVERYRNLARFYGRHGLAEERAFVESRLQVVTGPD